MIPAAIRRSQWFKALRYGLVAAVLVGVYAYLIKDDVPPPKPIAKAETKSLRGGVKKEDLNMLWQKGVEAQIDANKKQSSNDFAKLDHKISDEINALKTFISQEQSAQKEALSALKEGVQVQLEAKQAVTSAVSSAANPSEDKLVGDILYGRMAETGAAGGDASSVQAGGASYPTGEPNSAMMAHAAPVHSGLVSGSTQLKARKVSSRKSFGKYFPPGTAFPAMITGGAHATVAEKAGKTNPEPMHFYITGEARGPGNLKRQMKGCVVTADGAGRISKERIDVHLLYLTCQAGDSDEVVSAKIQGHVFAEDGVQGIRGKLYRGEAAMLMNSAIAGAIGGLSNVTAQGLGTSSVSPLGSTQTLGGKEVAQAGLLGGMGSASDKLQSFFISRAEESQPVVMVSPERYVTLVLSAGVDFDG